MMDMPDWISGRVREHRPGWVFTFYDAPLDRYVIYYRPTLHVLPVMAYVIRPAMQTQVDADRAITTAVHYLDMQLLNQAAIGD